MKALDLTGNRFGKLVVLKRTENVGVLTAWECQCDCGNICVATTKRLRNGTKQSCGCLSQKYPPIQIGDKINSLTVLNSIHKNNRQYWLCECECGNKTEVSDCNLKSGQVKSCGCLRRTPSSRRLNLTGQKFGYLTALKFDEEKSSPERTYWICKCNCSKETSILLENLTSKDRFPSCGCQTQSRGEEKIQRILEQYNIPFTKEQTFDTCINLNTGKKLRFDFYVNNSYLIEFDGKQHFIEKNGWENLQDVQYRDNIKNEWCKQNNIPLIRIPYTKYNSLSIEDLLLPLNS